MERRGHALKKIDLKKGCGLELGPLYLPVVLKSEANISYIDHMSTADLRKKYKGHPFPVEDIVEVDYVVGGSTLKKVVGGKKFDYVIASHVIEHIPDVVSWLQDVASILKPVGILSLVIPDKRFSFDISRDVSRPSEVMGAYLDKLTKSNSAMIYDSASEYRELSPSEAWANDIDKHLVEPNDRSLSEAMRRAKQHRKPGGYVDSHCYVFTPYSFFEILRRLIRHHLFDYEVVYFADTAKDELEFYVSLQKVRTADTAKQLASLPTLTEPPGRQAHKLTKEIERLNAQVQQLSAELAGIKQSKSWRITQPLRAINQHAGRK